MADEDADPEVDRLAEIMKKDEDQRQDADWDALAGADPGKLQAAAAKAGVTLE